MQPKKTLSKTVLSFFFLILYSFRLDVLSREGLFQPFCPPIMGLDNQLKTIINT